jgi:hypothetical protein
MTLHHEDPGSKKIKVLLTLNRSIKRVLSFIIQSPVLLGKHSCSTMDGGALWVPKPHVDEKVHFHIRLLCIVYRLYSL